MRRWILATLFTIASAYTVLKVEDECSTHGPKYWCKNTVNAEKCKATSFCNEHVWPIEKKNDLCATCKAEVTQVHSMLAANETQQYVIAMLHQLCGLFPEAFKAQCNALVDQYAMQAIQILLQVTNDSTKVCTEVGLCQANGHNVPPKKISRSSTDYCLTCEQYVGTLHLLISNEQTKKEIISSLEGACQSLPSTYSGVCDTLVELFASKGIDWLVSYTARPQDFCTSVGLCSAVGNFKQSTNVIRFEKIVPGVVDGIKKHIDGNIYCSLCEFAMLSAQAILANNTTALLFKEEIENLCSYLPKEFFSSCLLYVVKHEDQIYEHLIKDLNPKLICYILCETEVHFKPLIANLFSMVSEVFAKNAVKKVHVKSAVTCEVCTLAAGYLDDLLKDNSTESEIVAAVDQLCSYLPTAYKEECTQLVDTYGKQIIDLLVQELANPQTLCTELGLCSSSTKVAKKTNRKSEEICEVCKLAAGYLDDLLKGNDTESEIRAALDKLCRYFPSSVKQQCIDYVNTYSEPIIQLLIHELENPTTLCQELHICSSSSVRAVKKVHVKSAVTCEVCTLAAGYLDNLLKDNSTESEIVAAVDQLCSYLPTAYKEECTQLVDTYGKQIIDLLVQELANPQTLCKELGLCDAAKSKSPNSDVPCELCQFAMGKLQEMLKEKPTEAEIKNALNVICGEFSPQYATECKHLVNTYGDMILSMMSQGIELTGLCKYMGLCRESKRYALAFRQPLKSVSCDMCQYAVGYVDKKLDDPKTEQEIEKAIEGLCAKLPSAIKVECDALITEYGSEIFALIAGEFNPMMVCKSLKIC